ncbi:MAG: helix-hairpin-helix domain-containing protein [Candidatus Tritonobacter lacicola]|nr:helix-hairpin-helix domain-containing protein [Candidatus Tritonobacter lacicola]
MRRFILRFNRNAIALTFIILASSLLANSSLHSQERGISPRIQQIIEEQRYKEKGYVKHRGKWVSPEELRNIDLKQIGGLGLKLEIHFIDIGQGDSTLIKCPDGTNILIDGGPKKSTEAFLKYLEKEKVKRIDLLIATHPDEDHIGGLPTVVRKYDIGKYMDPGKSHTTHIYKDLLQSIKEKKVPYKLCRAGQEFAIGNVKMKVLHPGGKLPEDNNNCSIVVRVEYGKNSFLLTGDAALEAENEILERQYDIQSDFLKCGHHGSRHSCSHDFVKQVRPRLAGISCGLNNSYGHPKKIVLDRMKAFGATVFRTDQLGSFVIESDGINLSVRDMKKTLVSPRPPNLPFDYKLASSNETGQVVVGGDLKIDINKATKRELETLNGIGPKKAQAIIDYRENAGRFKQTNDIMNVKGIGPKTFEKNEDKIIVR